MSWLSSSSSAASRWSLRDVVGNVQERIRIFSRRWFSERVHAIGHVSSARAIYRSSNQANKFVNSEKGITMSPETNQWERYVVGAVVPSQPNSLF